MSEIIIAIVLGIVEGITEFLPISSTGHLILASYVLDFTGERADRFNVFIQLGAILAVVILYRQRFLDLLKLSRSTLPGGEGGETETPDQGFAGWRALLLLGLTTLPALVIGFLLRNVIDVLYNPVMVAIGAAAGGIAILLIEARPPATRTAALEALTYRQALLIGLFQCLAMWPGVSRSAATILGGMLVGLRRDTAAEYSFLAAVPALAAASLYSLYESFDFLTPSDAVMFAVGFIVSLIFAWLAIRWLIGLLKTSTLRPFGWYRLALAAVVFVLMRGVKL